MSLVHTSQLMKVLTLKACTLLIQINHRRYPTQISRNSKHWYTSVERSVRRMKASHVLQKISVYPVDEKQTTLSTRVHTAVSSTKRPLQFPLHFPWPEHDAEPVMLKQSPSVPMSWATLHPNNSCAELFMLEWTFPYKLRISAWRIIKCFLQHPNACYSSVQNRLSSRLLYKKLRGFSPQANYTDRATAACRRS
jgi:hypothetical protein